MKQIDRRNKKQLAAGAFAMFFLLMAICTAVSRAAAAMTIPQVDTQKVTEGKLTIQAEGKGVIEAKEEKLISLEKGLRIEKAAKSGSLVKAGDVLVQYDLEYLKEVIVEKQAELKKLELELLQANIQGQPQARVSAAETAQREVEEAETYLAKAWEDLDSIAAAWEEKKAQAQEKLAEEQAAAEEERQNAVLRAEDMKSAGQEEEAAAVLADAEAAYEQRFAQAQAEYDETVSQADAEIAQAQAEAESRESALSQAQNTLETARQEDEAAAKNDEQAAKANAYSQQAAQVDIDTGKKELEKLQQLLEGGGQVLAEAAGVINSTTAAAGGVTDVSSCVLLGCGGYQMKGYLSAEDTAKAEEGDKVSITIPGKGKAVEKTITGLLAGGSAQGENGGTGQGGQGTSQGAGQSGTESTQEGSQEAAGVFYADMGEDAVPGTQVTYEITRQTDTSYQQLIPVSSLRKDNEGTFCLVAEAEKTILGTEYTAKRVSVTVEAKDSSYAAVTSAIDKEDLIITGSSKDISPGDKVRLKE